MIPDKKKLIKYKNNIKKAANFFGVTEKTIINWFKKYNIYKPKKNYGCNKLNFKKALEIRDLYKNGLSLKNISKKYNVSAATISKVINNIIYKEIKDSSTASINVIYNTKNSLDDSSGLFLAKNHFEQQW